MRWKTWLVIGFVLLAIGMWWTRYQVISEVSNDAVIIYDRFTGGFWVVTAQIAVKIEEWIAPSATKKSEERLQTTPGQLKRVQKWREERRAEKLRKELEEFKDLIKK